MDLRFIKTVERPQGWVAMFADADVIGESGVDSIRSASKIPSVFNTIRSREGIHFYDRQAMWNQVKKIRELLQKEEQ